MNTYLKQCILLILILCASAVQAQTWQTYNFAQASCSASFPVAPTSAQENAMWTAQAKSNNIIYQIVVKNNASYTQSNSEALLSESIAGFINPTTDKIEKRESLTVGGLPAKQVYVHSQDGTYIIFQVVVGGGKLYQIAVMGTNPAQTLTNAKKFLESFKTL